MSRWNKVVLAYERPDLLTGWVYERNKDICSPEEVSIGSHVKVWWKCEKGHTWMAEVRQRVKGGGCPYCSGRRILPGFNDIASLRPDLLEEWDYHNNTISPQNVGAGSNRKVWWICTNCGHKWNASINNRTKGTGCPICGKEKAAAGRGTAAYSKSIAKLFPDLLREWDYEKNSELDPQSLYPSTTKKAWWICNKCGNPYYASISNRTRGSGCPVCAGKEVIAGFNDLKTWCNENNKQFILDEWDYNKNNCSPEDVAPFTSKKAWFICREGHSYKATISNRTSNSTGCPICEKARKTSFPEQALYYYIKEQYPNAVNSYHTDWLGQLELDIFVPEINTAIEYDGVSWHVANREKDLKKNEKCIDNGIHLIRIREPGLDALERCTNVFLRDITKDALNEVIVETLELIGCRDVDVDTERDTPYIVKQFDKSKKEKSIASRFPELLAEWDYDKNAGIDPEYVNYGSMRKFWWTCPICKNNWQMSPNARTNQGQGCPDCASEKRRKTQVNTLLTNRGTLEESNHPVLTEWDYDKNTVLPSQVTIGSKRIVWWKCKCCSGSWMAEVQNRTKENGTGCPYCSGRRVLKGFNDLTTTHPALLVEWDYEKNTGKSPDMFSAGSSERVWWKCSVCRHEWKATIHDRTGGRKCPVCQRKNVANKHQVKVINLDTGVIYNSLSEAAESCNGGKSGICQCCNGNRKTAYGYRWAYADILKN